MTHQRDALRDEKVTQLIWTSAPAKHDQLETSEDLKTLWGLCEQFESKRDTIKALYVWCLRKQLNDVCRREWNGPSWEQIERFRGIPRSEHVRVTVTLRDGFELSTGRRG